MPEQKQFFGGFQTYTVFNRTLENDYGKMHSLQDFALLSYGIFDWLSLDLKGGEGNIRQRSEVGPDINYHTFLGGGYGVRLRLYDSEKTKMIFGFQHISIHPHTASIGASKNKAVLDDWQFSFLASHDIFKITPYIGTRWSWMNQIHWIDDVRKLEKSDLGKSVGLLVGTNIPLSKEIWVNVEGQFFDATAVTGSINHAF
ncbi:MAG: hypothetical protein HZC18_01940 [Candidatus Omnitrophica bacterium]|nr:hypothetical protein [Candidatus Omnitrophota bacterium]